MWGGTDERESIRTIRSAFDHGINLIDTAPVYGFGRSEEIVGKALAEGGLRQSHGPRDQGRAGLARKVSLLRDASPRRIFKEIEASLKRLRTDVIDIYQVHWPDPATPIEETAEAMAALYQQGKIRAIGVSNFSPEQMDRFSSGRADPHGATALQSVRARHRGATCCRTAGRTASRLWSMERSAADC